MKLISVLLYCLQLGVLNSIDFSLLPKPDCDVTETLDTKTSSYIANSTRLLTHDYTMCWSVSASRVNRFIRFRFSELNFEYCEEHCRGCHFVAIYSVGVVNTKQILRRQCTRSPPIFSFTSTTNKAIVLFHIAADFNIGKRPFNLSITEVEKEYSEEDDIPCVGVVQQIVVDKPGSIQNYVTAEGNYRSGENCVWELKAVNNSISIRYTFRVMDIEGDCKFLYDCDPSECIDVLRIDDHSCFHLSDRLQCGRYVMEPINIDQSTRSDSITFSFTTSDTKNYYGFIIDYEVISPDIVSSWRQAHRSELYVAAGKSVQENSYRRSDNGRHRPFEEIVAAYYTLDVFYMFKIDVKYFDIGIDDSLVISCDKTVLFRAGGYRSPFVQLCDLYRKNVTFRFTTTSRIEGPGYNVTLTSVPRTEYETCTTTFVVYIQNTTHSSVANISNFIRPSDGKYRMRENTTWQVISTLPNTVIRLNLLHLNIDRCQTDWLAIYDGGSVGSPILSSRICGRLDEVDKLEFISSGMTVLIQFFANNSDDHSGDGFVLSYECLSIEDHDSLTSAASLVSVISAVILLQFSIIIIVAFLYKRKADRERQNKHLMEALLKFERLQVIGQSFDSLVEQFGGESLTSFFEEKEIQQEMIEVVDEEFGIGHFGSVSKAHLRKESMHCESPEIVLKRAHSEHDEARLRLLREGLLMNKLNHQNIMKLTGIVVIDGVPFLVLPCMALGSLFDYFTNNENKVSGDKKQLRSFCRQVCSGMIYLQQNRVIHRDLACRNVLVSEDMTLKISDFGLAIIIELSPSEMMQKKDKSLNYTDDEVPIAIRWHPPESFNSPPVVTFKTDVWSFGVVSWEIYSGCESEPYSGKTPEQVIRYICDGKRLAKPSRCSQEMYNLMLKCWSSARDHRPDFLSLGKSFGQQ